MRISVGLQFMHPLLSIYCAIEPNVSKTLGNMAHKVVMGHIVGPLLDPRPLLDPAKVFTLALLNHKRESMARFTSEDDY
jgi:hypothetical protein